MRIVLDTNVLVAALIAHGACSELLEHAVLHHEAVVSQPILDELQDVLVRKFRFDRREANAAIKLLKSRFESVSPSALPDRVCRDADDDMILATGVAGHCDLIVSGDKDLLILKSFQGIRIISPADFWKAEKDPS